ncbi:hypothetical protein AD935_00595 [Gluconobacter japonicus]|nr:hypothetical protein AD935_00595 [Gluconobacter japonicus]
MRQGRDSVSLRHSSLNRPVEAFNKSVRLRLLQGEIVPFDHHLIDPFQDGMGCELHSVVADNHEGFAISFNRGRQFLRNTPTLQRRVSNQRQVLPTELVDNSQKAETATTNQGIRDKI